METTKGKDVVTVQIIGGSRMIIIPMAWAKANNLEKGDKLTVVWNEEKLQYTKITDDEIDLALNA